MSETDFEPIEVSNAKDHVMEALRDDLDQSGFDSEQVDLIDLADCAVECLIKLGVIIPEDLPSLHGWSWEPDA